MSASAWSEPVARVRVRRSAVFAMNTTLLLDPEHAVVVDPGVLPSELDDLAAAVSGAGAAAVTLVFTHAHWDHVLGRPWWPAARTLAHDRFAAEVKRDAAAIRVAAEACATGHGARFAKAFEPFAPDDAVAGLHFHPLRPWRLVFRDAFGHCPSQVSVHLPDHRVLIAADMLSDLEVPILDGPPAAYAHTLEALLPLVDGGAIQTLVPGHGAVAQGVAAVRARFACDLDYLRELAARAQAARAARLSEDDAVAALEAMEYVGKRAAYSMTDYHRANARFAWRAAGGGKPGAARGGKPPATGGMKPKPAGGAKPHGPRR